MIPLPAPLPPGRLRGHRPTTPGPAVLPPGPRRLLACRRAHAGWSRVGGYTAACETLREMVSLPLRSPGALERVGLRQPRGVLLWGPPGSGRRLLAEAAAADAGAWLFELDGPGALATGRPLAVLSEALRRAWRRVPAVLLVTGWDLLAPHPRVGPLPPGAAGPDVTHRLLHWVDEAQQDPRVLLLGSCDRVDRVHPALLHRDGRFHRRVFVHPPTEEDRAEILRVYLRRRLHPRQPVDVGALARRTQGFVAGQLGRVCRRAAALARRDGRTFVTPADLDRALEGEEPALGTGDAAAYVHAYRCDCHHHYVL